MNRFKCNCRFIVPCSLLRASNIRQCSAILLLGGLDPCSLFVLMVGGVLAGFHGSWPVLNFSVADFESGQFRTDSNKPPLTRSHRLGSRPACLALPRR